MRQNKGTEPTFLLQGNIRVFCRVRPLIGEEMLGHQTESPDHMTFSEEDPKILHLEKGAETGANDVSSSLPCLCLI